MCHSILDRSNVPEMSADRPPTDEEAVRIVMADLQRQSAGAARWLKHMSSEAGAPSAIVELLRHQVQENHFLEKARAPLRAQGLIVGSSSGQGHSNAAVGAKVERAAHGPPKGVGSRDSARWEASTGAIEAATMLDHANKEKRISAAMTTHDDELFFIHDPVLPDVACFFDVVAACEQWANTADAAITESASAHSRPPDFRDEPQMNCELWPPVVKVVHLLELCAAPSLCVSWISLRFPDCSDQRSACPDRPGPATSHWGPAKRPRNHCTGARRFIGRVSRRCFHLPLPRRDS